MLDKLNNTTNRLKSSLNGFYKPNKHDAYKWNIYKKLDLVNFLSHIWHTFFTERLWKIMLFFAFFETNHLITPWRLKFRPMIFTSITSLQPANVLNPYLLSELANIPGCWSSAFEPTNLSYQVPMGLQQGISSLYYPFAKGITNVP